MKWLNTPVNIRLRHLLVSLTLAGIMLLPFLSLGQAHAVSKTWDGGCGADTTWSCANNWSDNIVPVAGDTVTFNATSTNNSVVDASFAGTVDTININAGYTGTISLSRSLTVSTLFAQEAGTFTAGGQTLNIATFFLTGGSFTASSGTTSVSGALTISGSPTFNANGGTFNFNGTGSVTLSCNNVTFNLVTFTNTAGIKTVSSNCSLPLGANPNANSGGSITNNGTLSGTGTFTTSGTFIFGSGSTVSGFTGRVAAGLTINGTANYGSYTTFTVTGTFTLNSGGTFTAPSGTASFANTFTINAGSTFNANGGTVNFNKSTSGGSILSCGNKTFNLVTFSFSAGTTTVNSDCNLPLGSNPNINGAGVLNLNGTLSGSGTLNRTGGGFTLNSGGVLSGFSGLTMSNITFNGSYNFSSYTTFSTSGALTVSGTGTVTMPHDATIGTALILSAGGTLTASAGTMSVGAALTFDPASTFNANGGTVNFNKSTSGGSILSCGNKTFNLVTFSFSAGTTTVNSDCNLPLGSNPNINGAGVLNLNGTLSGSGTLNRTGGGFTLNTGYALSGFTGIFATSDTLTVNATNANFSGFSSFQVAIFNISSGAVFTAPPGTAYVTNNMAIDSGATFNANGGTVAFIDGTGVGGTMTLACGNKTFNLVVFGNATSTKVVGSDCSFPLGANPTLGAGGLQLSGTLSGSGTLTKAYDPSGSGLTLNTGYVLSGFSDLNARGTLVIGPSTTANFSSFNSVTTGISLGIGTGSVFTAPPLLTVGSNFSNSGTFNANGGTVVLNGTNQTIIGDTTFYNLTKTVSSSDTLTFTAGNTVTVAGLLTLKGGSGGLLSLVSSVPGSAWFLNALGTTNVSYVDVADSNAGGGKTVVACNSSDSGNNTNWSINPASCIPSSGGTSASSAITNYVLLQASLAAQNQQSQTAAPGSFAGNNNLPSKIYDFIRQFPHKKELAKAIGQFLLALVIGIVIGMLILIFLLWRRRLEQEQEDREDLAAERLAAATPSVATTPPAEPGTTVMPTRPGMPSNQTSPAVPSQGNNTSPPTPSVEEPDKATAEIPQDKKDGGGQP